MKHRHAVLIVVSFVFLLSFTAVAFWLIPDRDFSTRENRALQTLPQFRSQKLFSGAFSNAYNDYYADQFVARDLLLTLKGSLELLAGKGENNGILLGSNGQLAKRLFATTRTNGEATEESDVIDGEHLKSAAEGINRTAQNCDVPFVAFHALVAFLSAVSPN